MSSDENTKASLIEKMDKAAEKLIDKLTVDKSVAVLEGREILSADQEIKIFEAVGKWVATKNRINPEGEETGGLNGFKSELRAASAADAGAANGGQRAPSTGDGAGQADTAYGDDRASTWRDGKRINRKPRHSEPAGPELSALKSRVPGAIPGVSGADAGDVSGAGNDRGSATPAVGRPGGSVRLGDVLATKP